jgi:hypothetical protein
MLASHRIVRYRVVEGFPRYRVGSDGSVWSVWKFGWKRLNPWRDDWGRLRVSFCLGTGRFVRKVSILVLEVARGLKVWNVVIRTTTLKIMIYRIFIGERGGTTCGMQCGMGGFVRAKQVTCPN